MLKLARGSCGLAVRACPLARAVKLHSEFADYSMAPAGKVGGIAAGFTLDRLRAENETLDYEASRTRARWRPRCPLLQGARHHAPTHRAGGSHLPRQHGPQLGWIAAATRSNTPYAAGGDDNDHGVEKAIRGTRARNCLDDAERVRPRRYRAHQWSISVSPPNEQSRNLR
jgi:hypothetical protein